MKRKIAVFTGTRAEYGLLYWLMKELQRHDDFELQVIAGAMHYSPEFGETWRLIKEDGFQIDAKVEMLLSSNTAVGVVKSMGVGCIGFADALDRLQPDLLIVLGDRFETLAIVQSALILQIPVAHLHGGEITEGAYDDAIRHAISKMSNIHFVSTEEHRRRVIQMGEAPSKVFNVGAIGLDHFLRSDRMSLEKLATSLNFDLKQPYLLVTYHSVTVGGESPTHSFKALVDALENFKEYQVLCTYPNADNGGREIIPLLEEYAKRNPHRVCAVPSLGFKRYLSAMSMAAAVVGNSSSGIIEAPSFCIPTVNIGIRQRGRLAADSVVHCEATASCIERALHIALDRGFIDACLSMKNPYGQGNTSHVIMEVLEKTDFTQPKKFYDLAELNGSI